MITALVYFVIYLLILGVVAWLLIYLVDSVPMFGPFRQIARVVITVVAVIILILLLLNLVGMVDGPGGRPLLR